jgi:muramidase (phage lysozyme)
MDKTVPAGAALLLNAIGQAEAPAGYDTIYGNNQKRLPKKITSMTIGEVIKVGPTWYRTYGSSAAGRYQFLTKTLQRLVQELGLKPTQKFDANLQDRLGHHLLLYRGYAKYVSGAIDRTTFGKELAKEWASFPVLARTQGAHHLVDRGDTYYEGDGQNTALITPVYVERLLDSVLVSDHGLDIRPPRKPLSKAEVVAGAVAVGAGSTAAATTTDTNTVSDTLSSLAPVVDVVSTLAASGGPTILWALALGAVAFVGWRLWKNYGESS